MHFEKSLLENLKRLVWQFCEIKKSRGKRARDLQDKYDRDLERFKKYARKEYSFDEVTDLCSRLLYDIRCFEKDWFKYHPATGEARDIEREILLCHKTLAVLGKIYGKDRVFIAVVQEKLRRNAAYAVHDRPEDPMHSFRMAYNTFIIDPLGILAVGLNLHYRN